MVFSSTLTANAKLVVLIARIAEVLLLVPFASRDTLLMQTQELVFLHANFLVFSAHLLILLSVLYVLPTHIQVTVNVWPTSRAMLILRALNVVLG